MKNSAVMVKGSLWFTKDSRSLGGQGRVLLLTRIGEFGSITRAAKAMGMSYKAAWDAVDAMNNLAGEPLVERLAGGRGGGGTRLTDRGRKLIETFSRIEGEHRRFLESASRGIENFNSDWQLIRRLAMKTSARNQFYGKVAAIGRGAVNDEVVIELPGGQQIVAIITHASVRNLGLKPGSEAFALIKASWVIVTTGSDGARLSARNCLSGKVAKISKGAVNAEVSIALPGQGSVVAIVTNGSVDRLGLQKGSTASAVFKASSVIVGIAA